jgi:hypothetical protein
MSAEAWRQAREWAANIIALADVQLASLTAPPPSGATTPPPIVSLPPAALLGGLAWGKKVSPAFRERVRLMCEVDFHFDPNWLMACMAFETGRTFSPKVKNPRSSATGLIQFMEATAQHYGTSTAELAKMTAEKQFDFVWLYFRDAIRSHGAITRLSDCYMAILNPSVMGKPDATTMWVSGSSAYAANSGLDSNNDHVITKAEAAAKVAALLAEGLRTENVA